MAGWEVTQPDLFARPEPVPYRRTSRTSRAAAEAVSQQPQVREAKRKQIDLSQPRAAAVSLGRKKRYRVGPHR